MRCPDCGNHLDEDNYCSECFRYVDNPVSDICPDCGNPLDEDNYCSQCFKYIDDNDTIFDEADYDSMVNDGSQICLNCTYWAVSPYGSAHGMICRRGYPTDGPGDSCSDFAQSHHFASYGGDGQYQFDETNRDISNKLFHWKNSR